MDNGEPPKGLCGEIWPTKADAYLPGQVPFNPFPHFNIPKVTHTVLVPGVATPLPNIYPEPPLYSGVWPKLESNLVKEADKVKGMGTKLDEGKPDYFLIPPNALNEVVRALTYGAKEHDSDDLNQEPNWKSVKNLERRFYSAAQRHQNAYRRGEKIDSGEKGSNCHHLDCAIAKLLFVLETELTKKESV